MAEFHVSTFSPDGFHDSARRTLIRRRRDAAGLALRSRIWDILHSLSLRDTSAGWTAHHDGIAAAESLSAGARSATVTVSGYVVLCERVA